MDEDEEEGGRCQLGDGFWLGGIDSDFGFRKLWGDYTLHSGGPLYYTTSYAIRLLRYMILCCDSTGTIVIFQYL